MLWARGSPLFQVTQIPGLNTLGISLGSLEVGFVTSNPENRLISKIIHKGDVFVFPIGLIHFQRNVGYGNAVAIAGLSSQNPGVITVANSVFGSKPEISGDVLAKAFQVDKRVVEQIQAKF
ncbi:Putative germin-like protein 2-3 [Linum perenne]